MKVQEIMTTPVVSVAADALPSTVAALLREHRISGVPVVDAAGAVVGLVSEYDLLSRTGATVEEVMPPAVISVTEDTDVDEVRHLLVECRIQRVPVLAGAKIGGYRHLNLGEEATVAGLMAAPRNYLFTTYREHGNALARGADPARVMADLFGRTTGLSAERGGSMHLFDAEWRLLGGYGIVGGQIPGRRRRACPGPTATNRDPRPTR